MKSKTLELQKQIVVLQRKMDNLESQESSIVSGYFYNQYQAWQSLCSAYQALPGLIGFHPMSSVALDGTFSDMSGAGRHLSNVNTALLRDLSVPVVDFTTGNSEYLWSSNSNFIIRGNEGFVPTTYHGLTIGAWVWFDSIGQTHGFLGRYYTTGANRSYLLHCTAANKLRMYASGDGTATVIAEWDGTMVAGKWYFVVGRFDPSTSVKIWVDDETKVNTTSVPATLNAGTAYYVAGAYGGPSVFTAYMDGKMSMGFVCAARLEDETITKLYEQTKMAFQ